MRDLYVPLHLPRVPERVKSQSGVCYLSYGSPPRPCTLLKFEPVMAKTFRFDEPSQSIQFAFL